MSQEKECMEMVTFSAKGGVQDTTVIEHARALNPWLKEQPGFISRSLFGPDQDGKFIDTVRWQSQKQAESAAQRVMEENVAAQLMEVVDVETITMSHLPVQI